MPKADRVYLTAYVPKEIEDRIYELKMRPEYVRMTKSDVARMLLVKGLELTMKELAEGHTT